MHKNTLSRDIKKEIEFLRKLKDKHNIVNDPDKPEPKIDKAIEALYEAMLDAIIDETIEEHERKEQMQNG